MKDNKKIIIIIVSAIIISLLGGTLAYWSWLSPSTEDTNITLTVGSNFSCSANGGGNINNTNYFAPTDCTNSTYAIQRTITTSITNNGTDPIYMDLWLNINSIGSGLSNSDNFRYALTTSSNSCTTGLITQGNFKGKQANDRIILLGNVTSGSTYYLYIWLDKAEESESTYNQSINLSLGGECSNETTNLPSFITESNAPLDSINSTYVNNTIPGIKWDEIASDTNGKGLYIRSGTEHDTNPIYYYRGAVDNNNVYFGGFCWKIVRTTETGGLKMIYNGTPAEGSCGSGTISQEGDSATIGNSKYNASYNDAKYVGYTYNNSGVETDSTIKGVIDTWYQNNLLTNYDSYLEDAVFCNDKSAHTSSEFTSAEQSAFYLTNSSYTYYGPTYRLAKKLGPSVVCPNASDAYTKSNAIGNGKLTYSVGLLTSDEIWMAGNGTTYYGNYHTGYGNWTYYLQNNNKWWSMSPFSWPPGSRVAAWFVGVPDSLRGDSVATSNGVRPVISLKPGQNFGYGNGTVGNPYRFVETIS